MLKYLHLTNAGPAPEMIMEPAQRLNIITGDNGLGKSFLLDIAWWALTRTWIGFPAIQRRRDEQAWIEFSFQGKSKQNRYRSEYDRSLQAWTGRQGRPANPGLVLYASVDGSFGVWDPARNYWRKKGGIDVQDRPNSYIFRPSEVWDGLAADNGTTLCNGLIRDWASWQRERGHAFELLKAALAAMSPSADEPLVPGALTRISLDDVRDMPTLRMPYGSEVAVVHASAGIRRITALVYLLVWAWQEHCRAAELIGEDQTTQVIFLIDEIDTHLHPRWQRLVLRSLIEVVGELMTNSNADVQILAATHSPLVLASVEPLFDDAQDALWHLKLDNEQVSLVQEAWAKQGDVLGWLVSDTFGLRQARSAEAEEAVEAAEAFMRGELSLLPKGLKSRAAIHQRLSELLPGHDPFWPRWVVDTGSERSNKSDLSRGTTKRRSN